MKFRILSLVLLLCLMTGTVLAVPYESDIVRTIRSVTEDLDDIRFYSYEKPVIEPLSRCLHVVLDDAANGYVITRPYVRLTYQEEIEEVYELYSALTKKQQNTLKTKLANELDPDESSILQDYFFSDRPDEGSYAVAVILPENGTLSADKAAANEGDLVTLTAVPAEGYQLSQILLNSKPMDGSSFTMPAASVTVTAVFEPEVQLLPGDINLDQFVDIYDAFHLFRHSMLPDLYPVEYPESLDFTHDGHVDVYDAFLLFRHSMLPDLYPLS